MKLENGKWIVTYPWKRDPNQLPNNEKMTILKSTEKRLMTKGRHAELYKEQMLDMLSRDAARKVTQKEIKNYFGPVHYINHHEVLKPDSKSTPCRIVFNSSASFRGHVLNEYWAKGPDMLINLLGLLLRFREGLYTLVEDIRKMYHSIELSLMDQHTHRFLWRDMNMEIEPDTFVMTRVSFEDRPAAAISAIALRKTAEMGMDKFPEAANIVLSNTYVDDIIDSLDSKERCISICKEIEEVFSVRNFKIKEWCLPPSSTQGGLNKILNVSQKVLGMFWDITLDVFRFQGKLSLTPKQGRYKNVRDNLEIDNSIVPVDLTRRRILSQINSMYDPIGLLAPFIVKAKILMRQLWIGESKGLGWDDPVMPERREEWCTFFREMMDLESRCFPRCLKSVECVGTPVLIIFCDGSEMAYGACANPYIRWKTADNGYLTRLLTAKCRVAPVSDLDCQD